MAILFEVLVITMDSPSLMKGCQMILFSSCKMHSFLYYVYSVLQLNDLAPCLFKLMHWLPRDKVGATDWLIDGNNLIAFERWEKSLLFFSLFSYQGETKCKQKMDCLGLLKHSWVGVPSCSLLPFTFDLFKNQSALKRFLTQLRSLNQSDFAKYLYCIWIPSQGGREAWFTMLLLGLITGT